jgi:hypothetical protein
MDQEKALRLCEELRNLVGEYPGANAAALRRAKEIRFAFSVDQRSNAYLQEKLTAVLGDISEWCSARKWQKYGADPQRLRGMLMNDLAKLDRAVEQAYGRETSA